MEEMKNIVRFESETGEVFEMIVLKEFDYKKKKYAILMDNDNCECDDCACGCEDDKECACDGHDCECNHEEISLAIFEISKDHDGNEIFVAVENEKLYDELIKKADEVLYEEE